MGSGGARWAAARGPSARGEKARPRAGFCWAGQKRKGRESGAAGLLG